MLCEFVDNLEYRKDIKQLNITIIVSYRKKLLLTFDICPVFCICVCLYTHSHFFIIGIIIFSFVSCFLHLINHFPMSEHNSGNISKGFTNMAIIYLCHDLFEYCPIDIYIFNILFPNPN